MSPFPRLFSIKLIWFPCDDKWFDNKTGKSLYDSQGSCKGRIALNSDILTSSTSNWISNCVWLCKGDCQVNQGQFQQTQQFIPGIGAGVVAVAVAVLADPSCSGAEGEFQGQPRPCPCGFHCAWSGKEDCQATQEQFQQTQLALSWKKGSGVVTVAVAVLQSRVSPASSSREWKSRIVAVPSWPS